MVVVLPAPFGPRKPNTSPRGTERSRSTMPGVSPWYRVRASQRMASDSASDSANPAES
jgi:hypothetical protein